jgi:hypothetical protein
MILYPELLPKSWAFTMYINVVSLTRPKNERGMKSRLPDRLDTAVEQASMNFDGTAKKFSRPFILSKRHQFSKEKIVHQKYIERMYNKSSDHDWKQ